ncbi:MAG: sugar ABC transporter substrate-binding protein [Eggerthellales bacterium]|nr:MAG: sugar ABC transporter substrate-binding protein [Eggerthellales bacterium]
MCSRCRACRKSLRHCVSMWTRPARSAACSKPASMIDRTFIDELASKAPTPGGGGASAYCGALAAALSSMVCNLTLGKAAYSAVQDEVQDCCDQLSALIDHLIELVEEDANAFAPLAAAYGMPRETPEEQQAKEEALQTALIAACDVPLSIMQTCTHVIELAEVLVEKGSRMALSDTGASLLFAKAALQGASLNVVINCASMTDRDRASMYQEEMRNLLNAYTMRADRAYETVVKELER